MLDPSKSSILGRTGRERVVVDIICFVYTNAIYIFFFLTTRFTYFASKRFSSVFLESEQQSTRTQIQEIKLHSGQSFTVY